MQPDANRDADHAQELFATYSLHAHILHHFACHNTVYMCVRKFSSWFVVSLWNICFEFICERFFSAFSIIQKVQRRQSAGYTTVKLYIVPLRATTRHLASDHSGNTISNAIHLSASRQQLIKKHCEVDQYWCNVRSAERSETLICLLFTH